MRWVAPEVRERGVAQRYGRRKGFWGLKGFQYRMVQVIVVVRG